MTPSEKKAREIIEVEWAGECERTGATTFSNHSLTFLKNCIASALDAAERRGFEKARNLAINWFAKNGYEALKMDIENLKY